MFSFLKKDENKKELAPLKYEIFHDESKEEAFWHIFLFVPVCNKEILVKELKETRKVVEKEDFSFKNINSGSMHGARGFLLTLCSALQQKEGKTEPYIKYIGDKKNGQICYFDGPLKVKVAIFKENHKHQKMKGHKDELSKIETTFRMGLQGANHFLFDKKNPLEICKIYLDGEEHYNIGYKRDLDKKKIEEKLKSNAKEYISFNADFEILDGKIEEDNNIGSRVL